MATAFCLINAEMGYEGDLLKRLKNTEGVRNAYAVYGVYDIIAQVEGDTMEEVKDAVSWRIRKLDKVRSTLTMIVVEQ
jgi:DNA-binding Lrp family transcriptional regulator